MRNWQPINSVPKNGTDILLLGQAIKSGILTSQEPIKPKDKYLAERNTGPYILTCKKVQDGYIVPVEEGYCYDLHECVKIIGYKVNQNKDKS